MAGTTAVGGKPVYSDSYKGVVLGLLVTAYTLNFIDRTIIATIGQAIKDDLKITDTQLGLLGGLYFALLYTLLGIPIARLAERFNRVSIISAAILIWSGFTALCGTATSFAQLAAYRFGVGFGEAGLSPPAHSLISDYFEPKKRATALSIYSFGIPLGTMVGAVAGGWLAQNFSWRIAFMLVGAPGILIAIVMKLMIKEPPRGHSEPDQAPASPEDISVDTAPKFSFLGELKELASVAGTLFGKWPVLHMVLGVTIASFGSYGSGQFVPPYFTRTFGLDYAQVGLITGIVGGISSGIGTLLGGFITDRLSKRSPRWYSLTPAIGLTIATPIYIAAYMQPSWQTAALILLIPGIFHYTYLGPTFGVVQNMVPTRRRATATALLFFFLNLIALGGGPPFTGWIIDQFAQFNFNHDGGSGTLAALGGLLGGEGGAVSFAAACPGGKAPDGASLALVGQCKASLVEATRSGVIVSICFYLWAAFHYLLGSIGLTKALSKARTDRGEAA
ncbi:MFS transporter [Phenylobacterium sp.]|uniref:spinster family MFS transporter n=1 Tax=Phenylobacterium sp. TaxID=1871053 RepID=UPI0027272669|nr:MFS transporter [Phenylobacterium sp.]MDO8380367.1 MFS transporter [Phenylobacterium sp.]